MYENRLVRYLVGKLIGLYCWRGMNGTDSLSFCPQAVKRG